MPPSTAMRNLSMNDDVGGVSKMLKSFTGNQISSAVHPMTISTNAALPQVSAMNTLVGAAQHQMAFPRGMRNRQTFHGKTEHNRVRSSRGYEMRLVATS